MDLSQALGHARFLRNLPDFLRRRISLEDTKLTLKHRLETREQSFLQLIKDQIFENPKSPYLPLLRSADCDFEDIKEMVGDRGLTGTLRSLRDAGVYVRFEEFKGREPLVRNGKDLRVTASDFDNSARRSFIRGQTGGSTGAPTRTFVDLSRYEDSAPYVMSVFATHDILHSPTASWRETLPASVGVGVVLLDAKVGQVHERWFSPLSTQDLEHSLRYRLATELIISAGRRSGAKLPRPEFLDPDNASVLARWAERRVKSAGKAVIRTTPSLALRVCLAAQEDGIDLTDTTFTMGSEPTTEGKARQISSVGARIATIYAIAEAGWVGTGCANPVSANDNHFMSDSLALISHPRKIETSGKSLSVDAFMFTSLRSTAAKILLNVELDDYGILEERHCGCLLEDLGYTTHVRDVFSFSKLTGEGVTLVENEVIRILEEVLPGRFGGSPLDYQLIEEEDERGLTKLSIAVSPKVALSSEQEVVDVFLEALKSAKQGIDSALFRRGQTVRVKRTNPIVSTGGKMLPLYTSHKFR